MSPRGAFAQQKKLFTTCKKRPNRRNAHIIEIDMFYIQNIPKIQHYDILILKTKNKL
jgi:hypothetical protein